MPEKKEHYDAFAVPRNFGEDGISFNGLSRRNLVEGCILAVGSGYPIAVCLPADLSLRIILLCFVSLPLFFVGLVGYGGESLSQFLVTVIKFLLRRRRLRYYIDAGEPEPEKKKGLAGLKSLLRLEKDAVRYKKPKRKAKKSAAIEESQKESRKIHNMAQEFFPIEDIRDGMVITKDKRYISNLWVNDIREIVQVGEERPVEITSLVRGEDGRVTKMEVSLRAAEEAPQLQMKEGNTYTGHIINFSEKAYYVRISGMPAEIRCPIKSNHTMEAIGIGDFVKFYIRGVHDGVPTGAILKVLKKKVAPDF